MIWSVLEADLGSSFTRPTYAKARAPKTPAMENAEVAVNTGVAVVSVMVVINVACEIRSYVRGGHVCRHLKSRSDASIWKLPRVRGTTCVCIHSDPRTPAKANGYVLPRSSRISLGTLSRVLAEMLNQKHTLTRSGHECDVGSRIISQLSSLPPR